MTKLLDLTGFRSGKVIVVSRGPNAKDGKSRWYCQCDCGNTCLISGNNLRSRPSSCGCAGRQARLQTHNTAITNLPKTVRKVFLRSYKRSAYDRGLNWELSDDYALKMAFSNCHYCGTGPSRAGKSYDTKKRKVVVSDIMFNGIDRKDSNLGYTETNTLPCCSKCNYAKRDMTYEEFIKYLDSLIEYRTKNAASL